MGGSCYKEWGVIMGVECFLGGRGCEEWMAYTKGDVSPWAGGPSTEIRMKSMRCCVVNKCTKIVVDVTSHFIGSITVKWLCCSHCKEEFFLAVFIRIYYCWFKDNMGG